MSKLTLKVPDDRLTVVAYIADLFNTTEYTGGGNWEEHCIVVICAMSHLSYLLKDNESPPPHFLEIAAAIDSVINLSVFNNLSMDSGTVING